MSDTVQVSSIRDQTATDVNKAARLPHLRDFLQSSLGCGLQLHHQVRRLQGWPGEARYLQVSQVQGKLEDDFPKSQQSIRRDNLVVHLLHLLHLLLERHPESLTGNVSIIFPRQFSLQIAQIPILQLIISFLSFLVQCFVR